MCSPKFVSIFQLDWWGFHWTPVRHINEFYHQCLFQNQCQNVFYYSFRTRHKICGSAYISSHNIICESSCSYTSTSISSYWPTTTQLHRKAARSSQSAPHTPDINLRSPEVFPQAILITPADQKWIVQCLYHSTGQMKQQFSQNWLYPPSPCKLSAPSTGSYYRQCMFLWAPMRM